MDGILELNNYDIHRNAPAGSHDPSMMWDPVTKRYYSYGTDMYTPSLGLSFSDSIGIPVKSSEDLVHFKYEGTVLSQKAVKEGRDNGEYPETKNFWAPYVEYVKGEYRMYYSATRAFGSSESRIWLAVADNPLGPFENRGVAADTWDTDDTFPNAIDAHIIWSGEKCYLIYGSFFGGIHIKELNPDTGLPMDGNPKNLGKCISRKDEKPTIDGPEGASAIYNEDTGYYYLFQSYGWLGNNYDIRVGRSKNVTGPFVDRKGRTLVSDSLGEKTAESYKFKAENPHALMDGKWEWGGFRGPGHGVPFYDPVRKQYFFVHHVRDGAKVNEYVDSFEGKLSYQRHYMMIRPMFFTDGWPVFGAEPYTGEDLKLLDGKEYKGKWEIILFDYLDNEQKESEEMELSGSSEYLCNGVCYECWDFENGGKTVAITGIDGNGNAYWGKKIKEADCNG